VRLASNSVAAMSSSLPKSHYAFRDLDRTQLVIASEMPAVGGARRNARRARRPEWGGAALFFWMQAFATTFGTPTAGDAGGLPAGQVRAS
jgi:hypothetical protein